MKVKLLLAISMIGFISLPANAITKRSIITYSNKAEKCEKKYVDYDADFSYMKRVWDDIERATNRNNTDKRYLKSFVKFSKTYCKGLKLFREALNSGVSAHEVEIMMIEFKSEMNRIRIENDVY